MPNIREQDQIITNTQKQQQGQKQEQAKKSKWKTKVRDLSFAGLGALTVAGVDQGIKINDYLNKLRWQEASAIISIPDFPIKPPSPTDVDCAEEIWKECPNIGGFPS